MEVLESGEQSVLQWDRKLSELSEPGESEALMYHTVRTWPGQEGAAGKEECCHQRNSWEQGTGMEVFGKRQAQNEEIWGEAWFSV